MYVILSTALFLCFIYIIHLNKKFKAQNEARNDVLSRALKGNLNTRILIKESGTNSDIDFKINQLIESYQQKIIIMEENELKRKELLSNISHDIRTPLTSIIGYLDAIVNNIVSSDTEKENYLLIANDRARQLKFLLDEIFELAKANSNELILNKNTYDINSILTDTLIEFIPMFEKESLELINNIQEGSFKAFVDEYSIKRVFENLINNAISHGKSGGIIGVSTKVLNNFYTIEIWDKGEGIDESLDKIFLRLHKKNLSKNGSSSGLGLAIAKTLIEKNDGLIEVKSKSNIRTSFIVHIPLVKFN